MTDWYRRFKQTDAFDRLVSHVNALPASEPRIENASLSAVVDGVRWGHLDRVGRRQEREHTSVPYLYRTVADGEPIRLRVEGRFYHDTFEFGFATVGIGRWYDDHTAYTVFTEGQDAPSDRWTGGRC